MKRILRTISLVMAVALMGACSQPSSNGGGTSSPDASGAGQAATQQPTDDVNAKSVNLNDDFYNTVNAEWLASTQVPADKPAVGGFQDLSEGIDKQLMADFDAMAAGEKEIDDELLADFIELYKQAMDFEAREAAGIEPIKPLLGMVNGINSISDLKSKWVELEMSGLSTPLTFGAMPDMGNAEVYALAATPPSLYIPDKSYYEEGNIGGAMLLEGFKKMAVKMMALAGNSEADAAKIVEDAMAFDAMLAPHMKGAEESSDYTKLYNPVPFDEFATLSNSFDLGATATGLIGEQPDKVVLTNPEYVKAIDELFTEENLPKIKNWMLVNTVYGYSAYLTEDFRTATNEYSQMMSGTTESMPKEEAAYHSASQAYAEVVGVYYGKTYFGEEARQDVTEMVQDIVATFEVRINANEWLSDSTKEMAVKKLQGIAINVGYPDKLHPVYHEMTPVKKDDGGSFASNMLAVTKLTKEFTLSQYNEPVDREQWPLSANTVNAMYNPMSNSINFPAAILQAPFYSLDQSASANYGGIGAVIAHEITHAFDPNGCKFDENGTLNDWWTEADYAAFEKLSKEMVTQFDGQEFGGGKVNGELTKAENVADAGGLACALEAVKQRDDANLEEFFTNWATIWRMKSTAQYETLLLTLDPHAPNKLRANIQLMNMDDFYDAFGIKEGDGMYLPPEERINIW